MLYNKLQADQLEARKNKEDIRKSLLTTLLGEIQTLHLQQKNKQIIVEDSFIYSIIKKFIKNIEESLKLKTDSNLELEKTILEAYLPTQMSEVELKNIIESYIAANSFTSIKDLGKIMGYLKNNHSNYDSKMATEIIKTNLNL